MPSNYKITIEQNDGTTLGVLEADRVEIMQEQGFYTCPGEQEGSQEHRPNGQYRGQIRFWSGCQTYADFAGKTVGPTCRLT